MLYRRRRISWPLLAAVCGCVLPARALDFEVEVGLGGCEQRGAWTPLLVRCALGPEEVPFVGRAVLGIEGYAVGEYAVPLEVPPGGEARAVLCVPTALGGEREVRLVDTAGRVLARAEARRGREWIGAADRLVLGVGGEGLAALRGQGGKGVRVATLPESSWPALRDPRSLAAVSTLALLGDGGGRLASLADDPAAVRALQRYVVDGGNLLFVARRGAPFAWRGTRLEALLPVEGLRQAAVGSHALAPLVGALPTARVPVATGTLRSGARWRQRVAGLGLLAERPLGLGRVLFLGFDPDAEPVRRGKRVGAFLLSLVAPSSPSVRIGVLREGCEEFVDVLALQRRPLAPLGFVGLSCVLLLHLVILGLAPAYLRRRGPWSAYLGPPLACGALGLGLLVAVALSRSGARAASLTVALHSVLDRAAVPDRGACLTTVACWSARNASLRLELAAGVYPALEGASPLDSLQFRQASPTYEGAPASPSRLGPLSVSANGVRGLALRTPPLLAPRLALERSPVGGLVLRSLEREARLEGVALLVVETAGVRVLWVGSLSPGEATALDLARASPLEGFEFPLEPSRGAALVRCVLPSLADFAAEVAPPPSRAGKGRVRGVLLCRGVTEPLLQLSASGRRLPPEQVEGAVLHLLPFVAPKSP